MSGTTNASGTMRYAAREVVGVFPAANALETAGEQLETAGVNRAAISVLGVDAERSGRIDALYRSAEVIEDDPAARQAAFVSQASRTEGQAFAISLPLSIGSFAGAWAVAAAGGVLAAAIGATIVGGAVGAGVGVLLVRAVARHHADNARSQLARGGLVLWVSTPDEAAEQRALELLRRCGGTSVHTHSVTREWGVENSPLHDVRPDPLLERDK
jgi:hypothetical protein